MTNQEEKFNIIKNWLSLHVDNINFDKLKRQIVAISRWQQSNCNGAIQAVTGFGKTYIGIFVNYLLNLATNNNTKTIVVVPSTYLHKLWKESIEQFSLVNVTVHVVNSYTKEQFWNSAWDCDLLICDEAHRFLGKESIYFSKVLEITKRRGTLLLSATFEDEEKVKLSLLNIPIVDTITMLEARRMGFVSDYIIYNYGIELNNQDREEYQEIDKLHNSMYARFQYYPTMDMNYSLARACMLANNKEVKVGNEKKTALEWRKWYAEKMEWDGTEGHDWSPKKIQTYAALWNKYVARRKTFLHKHPDKIKAAYDIITYLNEYTITFSESKEIVDKLTTMLGDDARAYHSDVKGTIACIETSKIFSSLERAKDFCEKNKGQLFTINENSYEVYYQTNIKIGSKSVKNKIIEDYQEKKFKYLCTAKALDEGFNIEGIECAIIISATSKQRQQIQRTGRAIRFKPNKIAKIINIYIKDTKDKSWLRKRQKNELKINWIDNINQIIK